MFSVRKRRVKKRRQVGKEKEAVTRSDRSLCKQVRKDAS